MLGYEDNWPRRLGIGYWWSLRNHVGPDRHLDEGEWRNWHEFQSGKKEDFTHNRNQFDINYSGISIWY